MKTNSDLVSLTYWISVIEKIDSTGWWRERKRRRKEEVRVDDGSSGSWRQARQAFFFLPATIFSPYLTNPGGEFGVYASLLHCF